MPRRRKPSSTRNATHAVGGVQSKAVQGVESRGGTHTSGYRAARILVTVHDDSTGALKRECNERQLGVSETPVERRGDLRVWDVWGDADQLCSLVLAPYIHAYAIPLAAGNPDRVRGSGAGEAKRLPRRLFDLYRAGDEVTHDENRPNHLAAFASESRALERGKAMSAAEAQAYAAELLK